MGGQTMAWVPKWTQPASSVLHVRFLLSSSVRSGGCIEALGVYTYFNKQFSVS